MNCKIPLMVVAVGLLTVSIFAGMANASEITVDEGGGGDYSTIHGAIDNANVGDTIYIEAGTYNLSGTLGINKALTIIANGTVIIEALLPSAIEVTANHVNIHGITLIQFGGISGIRVSGDHCNISGNNVSGCSYGIFLYHSNSCTVSGNNASGCGYGIRTIYSDHCLIVGNSISGCYEYGMCLEDSDNLSVCDNVMMVCGMAVFGQPYDLFSHSVDNNTVNGRPLYYITNQNGAGVPSDAGQIIMVNCSGVTVSDLYVHNTTVGIQILYSDNCTVTGNDVFDCIWRGMHIYDSDNLSVEGNDVSGCEYYGIYLDCSSHCTVSDNDISHSDGYRNGVYTYYSDNITVTGNNMSGQGVHLCHSDNITVTGNSISRCSCGVLPFKSKNILVSDNTMTDCGVNADYMSGFHSLILENNTVNGQPLYYITDQVGGDVPSDAGQVILVNCKDVTVSGLDIHNTTVGIQILYSDNITVTGNNISDCTSYGICLDDSDKCTVYANNFIDNNIEAGGAQAYGNGDNDWYFSNSGNYWNDYTGTDDNGDGIGDTSYSLWGRASDPYPLMDLAGSDTDSGNYLLWGLVVVTVVIVAGVIIYMRRRA